MEKKINKLSIILILLMMQIGCMTSSKTPTVSEEPISLPDLSTSIPNEQVLDESLNLSDGIPIGYLDFKIVSKLEKGYRANASEDIMEVGCDTWEVNDSSLLNIIQGMQQVRGDILYKLCHHFPCWYIGKVSNGSLEYEIGIYSTSYIILKNELEELCFILETPSDLFLEPCDCC